MIVRLQSPLLGSTEQQALLCDQRLEIDEGVVKDKAPKLEIEPGTPGPKPNTRLSLRPPSPIYSLVIVHLYTESFSFLVSHPEGYTQLGGGF